MDEIEATKHFLKRKRHINQGIHSQPGTAPSARNRVCTAVAPSSSGVIRATAEQRPSRSLRKRTTTVAARPASRRSTTPPLILLLPLPLSWSPAESDSSSSSLALRTDNFEVPSAAEAAADDDDDDDDDALPLGRATTSNCGAALDQ